MQPLITIEAIESKEFKFKARGYDPEEVDSYLDEICDEMSRQQDAMQKLQQQLKEARMTRPEPAPAPKPDAAPAATVPDTSVQEVLEAAIRLKNEILKEAQEKADAIVADAEKQAKERLGSLGEEHDRLCAQVEDLKKAAVDYRDKFETLLQLQKDALDEAADLFE